MIQSRWDWDGKRMAAHSLRRKPRRFKPTVAASRAMAIPAERATAAARLRLPTLSYHSSARKRDRMPGSISDKRYASKTLRPAKARTLAAGWTEPMSERRWKPSQSNAVRAQAQRHQDGVAAFLLMP